MKLTLQEARNQLAQAGTLNLDSQENIAIFDQRLNLVQERFLNEGKWSGTMQPVRFSALDDVLITLPRQFVSCLAVKFVKDGCKTIGTIQNQWYTYLNYGAWFYDFNAWPSYGYTRNVVDRGDGFVSFTDSPFETFYLRFTISDSLDAGKEIFVKGLDQDLVPVFTQEDTVSYEGLKVTFASPSVQTTQVFTTFTFAQKMVTSDWVHVDVVDTITGAVVRIANYEPSETTVSYRRYHTGCTQEIDYVEAICKRRFIPSVQPTDEVYPANLGALQAGLMAITYLQQGDPGRYDYHMNLAYGLLNGEMREERGGAKFTMQIDNASFQMNRLWQGR